MNREPIRREQRGLYRPAVRVLRQAGVHARYDVESRPRHVVVARAVCARRAALRTEDTGDGAQTARKCSVEVNRSCWR